MLKKPSLPAGTLIETPEFTLDELRLGARNHSMPLEALRYPITPIGLHYLLTHFDIPFVDAAKWRLSVGGRVHQRLQLTLEQLRERPRSTLAVTLECAGNGRARISPRPLSQPWLVEAIGTAEWTGTPLGPILREAGLLEAAEDVVFTGIDSGTQGGVLQHYERSLPIGVALGDEVLLAYEINGQPLPPQHGWPLRLVVPGWYGMASVKWLRSITVLDREFDGYQQAQAYHFRGEQDSTGIAVTRILPRALMVPPGEPDFMSRTRYLAPNPCLLEGRAWSGRARVTRVEVSIDAGESWMDARLGDPLSAFAWLPWTYAWDNPAIGEYELCVRATDAAGNTQPTGQNWSTEGVENNAVQRVTVVVTSEAERIQRPADEDPN